MSLIDEFHITWWPLKQVQLDGHHDWSPFDASGFEGIMRMLTARECTIVQISGCVQMQSIKVANQLHRFPWSPHCVKRVYNIVSILSHDGQQISENRCWRNPNCVERFLSESTIPISPHQITRLIFIFCECHCVWRLLGLPAISISQ